MRWLKFVLAIGVSLIFSYLFVRAIDVNDVLDALSSADYIYVAPALALFGASLCLRALRWRYLLPDARGLSWRELLPSLLVGYAGNNLLPFRAGELLRAQHLADRHGVARMETFGTLMMERLFDGFVLAGLVLWGLLLVHSGAAYLGVGLLLLSATTVGLVVCIYLALHPDLPRRLAASRLPIPQQLRPQLASLGESFLDGFVVLRSVPRFIAAAATSAAAWGLELSMYWLISRAFALDASFITVAFAGAAANVAMSLPAAQGGVGPFQFFATQALRRFDVPEDAAAAFALALHLFLVMPVSLVGLAVLWRSTLPSQRARRLPAAAVEPRD